jgi:hypothetical protein
MEHAHDLFRSPSLLCLHIFVGHHGSGAYLFTKLSLLRQESQKHRVFLLGAECVENVGLRVEEAVCRLLG